MIPREKHLCTNSLIPKSGGFYNVSGEEFLDRHYLKLGALTARSERITTELMQLISHPP